LLHLLQNHPILQRLPSSAPAPPPSEVIVVIPVPDIEELIPDDPIGFGTETPPAPPPPTVIV
jgi:hypothetical protein